MVGMVRRIVWRRYWKHFRILLWQFARCHLDWKYSKVTRIDASQYRVVLHSSCAKSIGACGRVWPFGYFGAIVWIVDTHSNKNMQKTSSCVFYHVGPRWLCRLAAHSCLLGRMANGCLDELFPLDSLSLVANSTTLNQSGNRVKIWNCSRL